MGFQKRPSGFLAVGKFLFDFNLLLKVNHFRSLSKICFSWKSSNDTPKRFHPRKGGSKSESRSKPVSVPAKIQKTENSNLHGFELLHRLSNKGTKLKFQVINHSIINQCTRDPCESTECGTGCHKPLFYFSCPPDDPMPTDFAKRAQEPIPGISIRILCVGLHTGSFWDIEATKMKQPTSL